MLFICIGENSSESCARGTGSTIEEAILNWATICDLNEALQEFCEWKPSVFQGEEIKVTATPQTTYTINVR